MLLQVEGLVTGYGKNEVLHGVSLEVGGEEMVAVIGSNGCGKSTLLKAIMQYLKAWNGSIIYNGKELTRMCTHELVKVGISFAPQGRQLFPDMTVEEHLDLGAWTVSSSDKKDRLEYVYKLFPFCWENKDRKASQMSGGQQQMLSIARTMMTNPSLLIMDEPSIGLSPKLTDIVFNKIREISDTGTAILIVEQNAAKVLSISDRGYVLDMGRNRFQANSKELLRDDAVRRAYLGM
jgi:ABC-type branched-subunit amino acid transport system ATPase component